MLPMFWDITQCPSTQHSQRGVAPLLPNPQEHHWWMHGSHSPSERLTPSLTFLSKSCRLSRHIFAASTLAGLSSFGSASIDMTDIRIFSTLWIGDQRSDALS